MTDIVQHIPAFVEGGEPKRGTFETVEQLAAIPFVAKWAQDSDFYQFSTSSNALVAERDGGRHWWVVGFLSAPVPELSTWEGGIHVIEGPDGKPLDVPGSDVLSVCGDDIVLRGGRMVKKYQAKAFP